MPAIESRLERRHTLAPGQAGAGFFAHPTTHARVFMGAERRKPVEHPIGIPGEERTHCKLRSEPLRELQHARKAGIDIVETVARDEFAVRPKRIAVIRDALTGRRLRR